MDKAYLRQTALRALSVILTALLIFYLVYHVFNGIGSSVGTTLVTSTSAERTLPLDGYIFRAGRTVVSSYSGSRSYAVADGSKVSSGTALATVYSTNANDSLVRRISQTEERIALLEAAQAAVALASNDTARTDLAINSLMLMMKRHIIDGNLDYALSSRSELLRALSEKQLQLYSDKDFGAEIASLYSELSALRSQLTGSGQTVSATESGYFYYATDGCEEIFNSSVIDTLTPSSFDSLVAKAGQVADVSSNAVGTLVTDFTWYIAAKVGITELTSLITGSSYQLIFPQNSDAHLSAKLHSIVTEAGGEALVIFSLSDIPSGFDFSRSQTVKVVTATINGLAVPLSAMRYEDGFSYVYILRGGMVLRRVVTVLDSFDGYYYVSANSESLTVGEGDDAVTYRPLAENEYVITYGTKLYHNKVIS